ncbi:hypothetical protein [Thorsellia anophelis]|uniref:DUF4123 domain-containing protein n=1 Tax=Thorsellia anophelis DSM 18579 TaxID=1123402 RepID=A0A1I0FBE3_9GAMM|nr:hypothetical protein [Thorsellia anophelis]SET55450.1 hypothetical protein SAMN02583745_02710 [Thorsellia anophelis DSM 18579]
MTITYLPTERLVNHRFVVVSHGLTESMAFKNDEPAVLPLGVKQLAPQMHLYPYLIDTHQLSYQNNERMWQMLRAYPLGKEIHPECYFLFDVQESYPLNLVHERLHRSLFYPAVSPEMILRYYDPRVIVPFSVIADLPHPNRIFYHEVASITYYLDGIWKTQSLPQTRTTIIDSVLRQALPLIGIINLVLGKLYRDGIEFTREEACLTLFQTLVFVMSRYELTHHEDLQAIAYYRICYGESILQHQMVLNLLSHGRNEPRYFSQHIRRIIKTITLKQ